MTMRAIRVAKFGGEENLKLVADVPVPKPSANEVLIRVKAAGINPVDTYIRQGIYDATQVPYTPGRDGAGIVEEVGESVKNFQKGDRVIAIFTQSGSYAEYCTANSKYLCPLHESLSFMQGAAAGIPYFTAYAAIYNKANVKPGETVLVHGASGAVGIAAVQILKAQGCIVIGTAGTPEGTKLVLEQGADKVFNHWEQGYMQRILEDVTNGQGVNVVIEMLSNVNLQADMEVISRKGRIVIVGCRGTIEINPRLLMKKESTVTGMLLGGVEDDEWKRMIAAVDAGQRVGWVKPQIGKVYKLEEASQGHHDVIQNTGSLGKLVIDTSV